CAAAEPSSVANGIGGGSSPSSVSGALGLSPRVKAASATAARQLGGDARARAPRALAAAAAFAPSVSELEVLDRCWQAAPLARAAAERIKTRQDGMPTLGPAVIGQSRGSNKLRHTKRSARRACDKIAAHRPYDRSTG